MTSTGIAIRHLLVSFMLVTLAACTAPAPASAPELAQTSASAPEPAQTSGSETPAPVAESRMATPSATSGDPAPVRAKSAPPMSDPLQPEVMPTPAAAGKPPVIDQTCKANADCVVKDVGNCCGTMPACVNRNSRTDPAAVQAECARNGMASVCGFNEITACTCASGQCISEQEPVGGWINGAAPPQADR